MVGCYGVWSMIATRRRQPPLHLFEVEPIEMMPESRFAEQDRHRIPSYFVGTGAWGSCPCLVVGGRGMGMAA